MMTSHQQNKRVVAPAPLTALPPRTFETERLMLRAMRADDAELVFKSYASDPEVTKYLAFPCASHPDESRPFVKMVADNFEGDPHPSPEYVWLVFRRDSGECIGSVALRIKSTSTLSGGYAISRSSWGQGFAAEAWRPVLEWGKSQPNVHRFEAAHHPDNSASGSVLRKLGLSCEGVVRNLSVLPNVGPERVDMVAWAWMRSTT